MAAHIKMELVKKNKTDAWYKSVKCTASNKEPCFNIVKNMSISIKSIVKGHEPPKTLTMTIEEFD
jgi:hypothetical protein